MVPFFSIIQLIIFTIYASNYASTMQKITRMKKLFLPDALNTEKIDEQISFQKAKVKNYKRTSLLFIFLFIVIHLLFVVISKYSGWMDYMNILIVGAASLLFWKIITWMKGAGTIDNKPRFLRYFRI